MTANASLFALIGHMDNWPDALRLLEALSPESPQLSIAEARELLPWIPPRPLFHVTAHSAQGHSADGVYIDTFIAPEALDAAHARRNVERVRDAAHAAERTGARIATLGGFSSIVLEGNISLLGPRRTRFTTGNTLTTHFILQQIDEALDVRGERLDAQRVLIVGSTGDIGSALAATLAPRVRRLLLSARNESRLQRQSAHYVDSIASVTLEPLLDQADLIITVASSELDLTAARDEAIICDAGYPQNVTAAPPNALLFGGGKGILGAGYTVDPPAAEFWRQPDGSAMVHGCLMEGILLALDGRFEEFSTGRGHITAARIAEIATMAEVHGFRPARIAETEENRHGNVASGAIASALHP